MKYQPGQTFKLKDGSRLKIVFVTNTSVDAVLVTVYGDYIEYEDVDDSTIDAIIRSRR